MSPRIRQYVQLRLEGVGTREAARRAGYAHGRPSPGARAVWARVEQLRSGGGDELREHLAENLTVARRRLDAAQRWVQALECLKDGQQ